VTDERDDVRPVVEWWSSDGGHHFCLSSDGTILERRDGQWVPVPCVPPGVTVARFARDLCTRADVHVRFLLPQLNTFWT